MGDSRIFVTAVCGDVGLDVGWDLMKYFFKKIILSKLILHSTQLTVNASLALNSNGIQHNPLLF